LYKRCKFECGDGGPSLLLLLLLLAGKSMGMGVKAAALPGQADDSSARRALRACSTVSVRVSETRSLSSCARAAGASGEDSGSSGYSARARAPAPLPPPAFQDDDDEEEEEEEEECPPREDEDEDDPPPPPLLPPLPPSPARSPCEKNRLSQRATWSQEPSSHGGLSSSRKSHTPWEGSPSGGG
jgi:hypothetical protein